jgi:3-oxoacyl-[acyl-carrier protein] reductase
MDLALNGRVALVTGAARDVGREIALTLAAEGTTVAVNYLSSAAEAEAARRRPTRPMCRTIRP